MPKWAIVILVFAPWCALGQGEGVWRRFGERSSDNKGYNKNRFSFPRSSTHSHNVNNIEEEGAYNIPDGYKFAYGWESTRLLRVERIKKSLEQGLREHHLLFPDERIAFVKEVWEEVRQRQSTRHLFVMDQFGRIRLLVEAGGSDLIAMVAPKGVLRKLGGFIGKRLAMPVAQAVGLSLVYAPIARVIGVVPMGMGGGSAAVGCHQEGATIHCGAH